MAVTKLSFSFSQSLTLVFKSDTFNNKFSLWSSFCRDTYSCLSISLESFISLDRALILQLISQLIEIFNLNSLQPVYYFYSKRVRYLLSWVSKLQFVIFDLYSLIVWYSSSYVTASQGKSPLVEDSLSPRHTSAELSELLYHFQISWLWNHRGCLVLLPIPHTSSLLSEGFCGGVKSTRLSMSKSHSQFGFIVAIFCKISLYFSIIDRCISKLPF